jgi:hypothetical protein
MVLTQGVLTKGGIQVPSLDDTHARMRVPSTQWKVGRMLGYRLYRESG